MLLWIKYQHDFQKLKVKQLGTDKCKYGTQ